MEGIALQKINKIWVQLDYVPKITVWFQNGEGLVRLKGDDEAVFRNLAEQYGTNPYDPYSKQFWEYWRWATEELWLRDNYGRVCYCDEDGNEVQRNFVAFSPELN